MPDETHYNKRIHTLYVILYWLSHRSFDLAIYSCQGAYYVQVKNAKKSINRLKEALLQQDLVVSLCLLMAQQRYSIVFKEGVDMHLKLVGQMLDQVIMKYVNVWWVGLDSHKGPELLIPSSDGLNYMLHKRYVITFTIYKYM